MPDSGLSCLRPMYCISKRFKFENVIFKVFQMTKIIQINTFINENIREKVFTHATVTPHFEIHFRNVVARNIILPRINHVEHILLHMSDFITTVTYNTC